MSQTESSRPPLAVVILAAGLGTRMKSDVPKVLHEVCGRPMLSYVIDAALSVSPERVVVVTGPEQDEVGDVLPVGCERAVQQERRGTGDAVRAGLEPLDDFHGDVVVLVGDAPLVDGPFLRALVEAHRTSGSRATVAAAVLADPGHYGRVVRDADGGVRRIVEARDASADELLITEVNTGFYVVDAALLRTVVPRLQPTNAQGELYLTDAVHLALADGVPVQAHVAADPEVMLAVNSRVELAEVNAVMRRRLVERLMLAGVTVEDPDTTFVDWGVDVGRDTLIRANSHLLGRTTVGAASEIGPGSFLRDAFVGDRARVVSSHLCECVVELRLQCGSLRLHPAQHGARRGRQGRHLRRDQEQPHRRGQQGAAPQLRRRRHRRQGHQHRRRQHHGQLRRLPEARDPHRRRRAHGQRHDHRGAGHHRRRRLHGGRLGDHQGCAAGRPGRSPAAGRRTSTGTPSAGPRAVSASRTAAPDRILFRPAAHEGRARVRFFLLRDRHAEAPQAVLRAQQSRPGGEDRREARPQSGRRADQDLRQRRDLRALRGERARHRPVHRPVAGRPRQRRGPGAAHHDPGGQARLGAPRHRRHALLRLLPPGQEERRARAHHRTPHGRRCSRRPAPTACCPWTSTRARSRASSRSPWTT